MHKLFKFLTVLLCVLIGTAFLIGFTATTVNADSTDPAVRRVQLSESVSGFTLLQKNRDGMIARIDIGSIDLVPVTTPQGSFVLPRIAGFSRSFEIGEPNLPVATKLISIPFGSKVHVKVVDYETVDINLASYGMDYPVMPVQPSLSKSQDPMTVPFEYDSQLYDSMNVYSLPPASAKVLGTMRSTRLARLEIAPVEYLPKTHTLSVRKSITVSISFSGADWDLTEKMEKNYSSPMFSGVRKKLLNIDDSTESDLVKYPVKYMIIADRMFESQLAPFIAWKTKKGFNVVVGYTDTIGTTTTAIKQYIQNAYNAGTAQDPAPSFVLFVGDVQQIPNYSGSAGSHITDLRYCEFTGDDLPEIYYGRFSAQNTTQLQPQIDKTLQYEQYTMPDPSYLGDVTLVSGVDSYYAQTHGNGQINYGTTYYFNSTHGITPNVWLYPDSDASGASAAVIQTISNGVGFYNYTAHCSHDGPADPVFDQGDISGLSNTNKYLLGIGNCCLSNTFGSDYSTPCFGEAWLQAANKGGIGWIGGSNSTYWDEDYWWGVGNGTVVASGPDYADTGIGAYDGVFHDHGEPVTEHYITNGAIIFCGNTAVTEAGSSRIQYYWEIYHLMGDPSVMTYMGVPSTNSVSHASSISPSATSFTVSAEPGSYVGITKDGVLHGAGYVGTSGSASISVTPFASSGTAVIVVTCQNKIPYEANIAISSGTEPPTAAFAATPTSGIAPLTVNFTDQSIAAETWSWDFGDTTTSTQQNPTHQYTGVGTYTVTLTVTNAYGNDSVTRTNYITVSALQAPVADFSGSPVSIVEGGSVSFSDESTNNPTTWSWSFQGGTPATSTDQNPTVSYSTAGTYTVSLTSGNAAGSDSVTKTGYITVTDQPLEYCASQGNNCTYEWIGRVQIGTLDNSSGADNYTDFTSIVTNYTAGNSYSVTLTPEFSSSTYTEYWKVWIDLNVDGDFDDAGEELFTGTGSSAVSGTLTIPAGTNCVTRMRVSMKWNAWQTSSCEAFSYGEVEDYTVNIAAGTIVDPPVADFHADVTTINTGQSVNFTDDSTNGPTAWSWSFPGGTPSTSSAQNPTVTYNTAGTYEVTLTASNSAGSDAETKTGYITVNGVSSSLVLEHGTVAASSTWQTINLQNTYTSMVVVCSNDIGGGSQPAVVRIRNASGNSFDVKVQNPGGSAISGFTVHYLVVEEGVYNVAEHGIKMEAVKALSNATANATSWTTEQRTYSNSYTNPVVVGQVMTYNDVNWSVFWASSSIVRNPPSSSELYAGKHVGEDSNKNARKSRSSETIGYIVIEQGSGTINGIPYAAAVGTDTVRGPDNTSVGYTYNFGTTVANASTAIVSAAAMDGANGGWPVLFGSSPLSSTSMKLAFDEDDAGDSERRHSTEQVAYFVLGQ